MLPGASLKQYCTYRIDEWCRFRLDYVVHFITSGTYIRYFVHVPARDRTVGP